MVCSYGLCSEEAIGGAAQAQQMKCALIAAVLSTVGTEKCSLYQYQ